MYRTLALNISNVSHQIDQIDHDLPVVYCVDHDLSDLPEVRKFNMRRTLALNTTSSHQIPSTTVTHFPERSTCMHVSHSILSSVHSLSNSAERAPHHS